MTDIIAEFKQDLSDLGAKFGKENFRQHGCDWYAWIEQENLPDCECNDKPPALFIYPSHVNLSGADHYGVEFEICAETHGVWFRPTIYAIQMEEAIAKTPKITKMLRAAWIAACEVKDE